MYNKIDLEKEKNKTVSSEIEKQNTLLKRKQKEYAKSIESIASLQNRLNSSKSITEKTGITQEIEEEKKKLDEIINKRDKIQQSLDRETLKQQQINSKISEYEGKINSINLKEQQKQSDKLKEKVSSIASQVKRWTFALFSVGTAYAIVTKAANAYLNTNTSLQNQLNSIWNVLGTLLAPAINFLVDILSKAIGYLDVFVKALTGVSIIAKANANALKKQTKAQKELNKEISDFDEIRKVNDETSNTNIDSSIPTFKIPELDETIVLKLQELAKWLQENWSWLSKLLIAFGAVFGASVIAGWLSNIATLIGGGSTGLIGLQSILKFLGTLGVITIGVSLIYTALTGSELSSDLKQIKEDYDYLTKSQESYNQAQKNGVGSSESLISIYQKLEKQGKITEEQMLHYIDVLIQTIDMTDLQSDTILQSLSPWEKLVGINSKHKEMLQLNNQESEKNIEELKRLAKEKGFDEETTKKLSTAIEKHIANLENQCKYLDNASDEYETNYNAINRLKSELKDITGKEWKIKSELDEPKTAGWKRVINGLLDGLAAPFKGLGFNIKVPHLAKGGITTGLTHAVIGDNYGGQEAVIPLNDDTMYKLAKAITQSMPASNNGSNIVYVQLNGRTIQKEIQKMERESDFEQNR